MTTLPAPTVSPARYTVSLLPESDVNYRLYVVEVMYWGDGHWGVINGATDTRLGIDGAWADGIKPYGRGDDWLDAHRFDLDTALRLAQEAAPHVIVNGRTAADAYRLTVGEAS